ncbi:MAG: insulinase family protein [Candidatus Riflebacteria bacterium]|nr:insulinase family protein [Candidatus Riflebacteria bacterium]
MGRCWWENRPEEGYKTQVLSPAQKINERYSHGITLNTTSISGLFSNIHSTFLENGLGVVVHSLESPAIGLSLSVLCGPIWETAHSSGVSHFLEHMVFRGIPEYPSAKELALALDSVGSESNAATFCDLTTYSQKILPEHIDKAIKLLKSMVTEPVFEGIETERKIILEECMEDIDEKGQIIALDQLSSQLIYEEHPYSNPILGTPETVKKISRSLLKRHLKTFYRPERMIITISGAIEKNKGFEVIQKTFGDWPTEQNYPLPDFITPNSPEFMGPQLKSVKSARSQVSVRFSYKALSLSDKDFFIQKAIVSIIDSSSGSPLRSALQEKNGLCYSLFSGVDAYQKDGAIHVDLSVQPLRVVEAVEKTLKVFRRIAKKGFSQEEIQRMKDQYIKERRFSANDLWEFSARTAMEILFGMPNTLASELDQLTQLNVSRLNEVSSEIFNSENLGLLLVGPISAAHIREIKKLLKVE